MAKQDPVSRLAEGDPPPDGASLAWRCAACGRLRIYAERVPRPPRCGDCGHARLETVDAQSRPADPGADAGTAPE